jgi:hypothetical protein
MAFVLRGDEAEGYARRADEFLSAEGVRTVEGMIRMARMWRGWLQMKFVVWMAVMLWERRLWWHWVATLAAEGLSRYMFVLNAATLAITLGR